MPCGAILWIKSKNLYNTAFKISSSEWNTPEKKAQSGYCSTEGGLRIVVQLLRRLRQEASQFKASLSWGEFKSSLSNFERPYP